MSGGDQADQASCEFTNSPCTWNNGVCFPTSSSVMNNFMAIQLMQNSVFGAEDDACQQDTSCAGTYCVENDYDYGTGCGLSDARKYELLQAESDPNIPALVMKMWETDASVETCEATATNPQDCEVNSIQEAKTSCQGTGTGTYFDEILNAFSGGGSNSDSLYDSLIARYASIPYYSVADMCAAWEIQVFCSVTSGSQAECTHSECQWGLRDIANDPSHMECLANNPTFNSTYVEMQWKIRSLHADQDNICRQRSSSSECTSDADCAFMSHWGSGGECAASYSFITDAVANAGAPLHIQTFAKLDNLGRLCEPLDPASCDSEPKCSYDSDLGSCGTDAQYYIGNALSTDACDSYADFSLLLAAFSDSGSPTPQPPQDSGSPTPQPPQDSVVGTTLWEFSTNLTELTDAVGLVATCDYPYDDADLSGEGTMKMVLFDLTHAGARTLVKPLEAGEKANVAGCHYKVHDVDEVTAAWKCRTSATLATTAFTPDAFSLRTITYLKSSVVSTRPYSQSDVEEAALEGVCECASEYVKHGFLDVA